jgi:hypothetical protein
LLLREKLGIDKPITFAYAAHNLDKSEKVIFDKSEKVIFFAAQSLRPVYTNSVFRVAPCRATQNHRSVLIWS